MWPSYKSILTAKTFNVMGLNISDRSNKLGRPFMEVTQWEVEWASYVRGYTVSHSWPSLVTWREKSTWKDRKSDKSKNGVIEGVWYLYEWEPRADRRPTVLAKLTAESAVYTYTVVPVRSDSFHQDLVCLTPPQLASQAHFPPKTLWAFILFHGWNQHIPYGRNVQDV